MSWGIRGAWALLVLLGTACGAETSATGYQTGEELPGGAGTNTFLFGSLALSRHAENLSDEHEIQFFSGNGFFNQPWVTAPASTDASDGLGPLFNARSCSGCHSDDGRGAPPLEEGEALLSMLFRLSIGEDADGMPIADPVYGGQVQPYAILGVTTEAQIEIEYEVQPGSYPDGGAYQLLVPSYRLVDTAYGDPDDGIVLSPRVAPAMHGLGLLEAIPEGRLEELADEDDEDGDGVSGRVRWVPNLLDGGLSPGRFGWKNEQPTVFQQTAGAFLGDMGLVTSLFLDASPSELECTDVQLDCIAAAYGANEGEPEVSDTILERVVLYSRTIAVPMRSNAKDEDILRGKALFDATGCSDCHTPSHETGMSELEELSGQLIFPYTDLLLHDMGKELADGEGKSEVDREWRTAPLWALRFYPTVNGHDRLLHDGRARGVEEAILWHGGEGENARDAFMSLSSNERQQVISFVESL